MERATMDAKKVDGGGRKRAPNWEQLLAKYARVDAFPQAARRNIAVVRRFLADGGAWTTADLED